jgi:hypothetical protein
MGSKVRDLVKLSIVLVWSYLGLQSQPLSTPACEAKLTVRVYDSAGAAANTLSRAQLNTDRVFKRAGIELYWVHCTFSPVHESPESSCAGDPNLAWTKITILPKPMVKPEQRSYGVFGLTLPTGVVVFSNKMREFARWYGFSESQVLSMVTVHELGHVLLGLRHGSTGLMRAELKPNDLRSFISGTLGFTRQEAGLMQARLSPHNRPIVEFPGTLHVPELASRECGASAPVTPFGRFDVEKYAPK